MLMIRAFMSSPDSKQPGMGIIIPIIIGGGVLIGIPVVAVISGIIAAVTD